MGPPARPPAGSWNRRAHQMLSTTAASSSTMISAHSSVAAEMCSVAGCCDPGRSGLIEGCGGTVALLLGLTFGLNRYRCSPMTTTITTPIIAVMMARMRTSRSFDATAL